MLKLSDLSCKSTNLKAFEIGERSPQDHIDAKLYSKLKFKGNCFSKQKLQNHNISTNNLKTFCYKANRFRELIDAPIPNSPLHNFPVFSEKGKIQLLLPSAISSALRTYFLKFIFNTNRYQSLMNAIGIEYSSLFQEIPLLGELRNSPIYFQEHQGDFYSDSIAEIDEGYYIHFLLFLDPLTNIQSTGIAGNHTASNGLNENLPERIQAAYNKVSSNPTFRKGKTLLVHCGIGRGFETSPISLNLKDWDVEFMTADDLATISLDKEMNPLYLFRNSEALDSLKKLGVTVSDVNDHVNLLSLLKQNKWKHIGESLDSQEKIGLLSIAPSFAVSVREQTSKENQRKGLEDTNGTLVEVISLRETSLDTDDVPPMYFAVNSVPPVAKIVYQSTNRNWWFQISTPKNAGNEVVENIKMMTTWIKKIVPVLQNEIGNIIPKNLQLNINFEKIAETTPPETLPSSEEITAGFSCSKSENSTVKLDVGQAFFIGMSHPTNISEKVMVSEICKAFTLLSKQEVSNNSISQIASKIVFSDDARYRHCFRANEFRDYIEIQQLLHKKTNEFDINNLKIGLGFRTLESKNESTVFTTKKSCTDYLNSLVKNLESSVCDQLRRFDRKSVIQFALQNHEHAVIERNKWRRTSKANSALHNNSLESFTRMAKHTQELTSITLSSKTIIELAICESLLENGLAISEWEYSKIACQIISINYFGGWSDTIHLGMMKAEVEITSTGDVLADSTFDSNVMLPFSMNANKKQLTKAAENYEENLSPNETILEVESRLDQDFIDALQEELGFRIDTLRKFRDLMETMGIKNKTLVFEIKKYDLLERLKNEGISELESQAILKSFSLIPRDKFHTIPDEFENKDIQLWRFRRQLSVTRRPILQINLEKNSTYIIAPGIVRDSMNHVLENYYEGAYPDRHYISHEMKIWKGRRANERGSEFSTQVRKFIEGKNWKCHFEIKITEILGRSLDKDYGDIDVLAWNEEEKKILLIECKDLHYHKTYGEIAEQIGDFLGEVNRDGKRDHLLKHIDRVEVLKNNKSDLLNFLKMNSECSIEGWIIFKNPVPMLYSWSELNSDIKIGTFDDLSRILEITQ